MERVGGPSSLFRTSFLDKGLVTFGECVEHYAVLDPDALLDEMRLMLSPPMLAVPFSVASARYYALMDALIRCAGGHAGLRETQRAKLVGICVDIAIFLRGRTPDSRAAAFETALHAALEAVDRDANYPQVAEEIRRSLAPAEAETPFATEAADLQFLAFDQPPPRLELAISA